MPERDPERKEIIMPEPRNPCLDGGIRPGQEGQHPRGRTDVEPSKPTVCDYKGNSDAARITARHESKSRQQTGQEREPGSSPARPDPHKVRRRYLSYHLLSF
jgi:hypothetical protein